MNKFNIFFISIILIISGCTSKEEKNHIDDDGKIEIDLSENQIKNKHFKDIIEDIEVVNLKNIPIEDYIGVVNKIIFYKGLFYLIDISKSNLLVFNRSGDFLYKIGKRGGGPGEFRMLNSVAINNLNDTIYLFSINDASVFIFDLKGKFIKRIRIDSFFPNTFALVDNKYFAFDSGYGNGETNNLVFTDLNGKIISKHFPSPDHIESQTFEYTGGLSSIEGKTFYQEATSSTLYSIDNNLNISQAFDVKIDASTWPNSKRHDFLGFMNRLHLFNVSYIENLFWIDDEIFFFNYTQGNMSMSSIYFKKDNKILVDNDNQDNLLRLINVPIGQFEKGKYISFVDPESLSHYKKQILKKGENVPNVLKNVESDTSVLLLYGLNPIK